MICRLAHQVVWLQWCCQEWSWTFRGSGLCWSRVCSNIIACYKTVLQQLARYLVCTLQDK